jgi:hypothetical protein
MEALCSSEMLVITHQITRRHVSIIVIIIIIIIISFTQGIHTYIPEKSCF